MIAFRLRSVLDKGSSQSFYNSDSTLCCFCLLIVPCFSSYFFFFLTVSSYFLEFYLWQFSVARVKVGFPWKELPVLFPGDWRHSWPHPPLPLETQLSTWGFLDLRLFQANTCIRSSLWLWVLIGAGVSPLHLAPRLRQVIVLLSSGVSLILILPNTEGVVLWCVLLDTPIWAGPGFFIFFCTCL